VGQGLVPYLLTQFQDWHKLDIKHKRINLRKALLSVLKNITNLSKYLALSGKVEHKDCVLVFLAL
jgi:hypothetical protein